MEKVIRLSAERGVVVFTKSSCCLCYAVNILFQELQVDPVVHEIDKDPEGKEMEKALTRLGCSAPVPAVFIGGTLVGSTNEHPITGHRRRHQSPSPSTVAVTDHQKDVAPSFIVGFPDTLKNHLDCLYSFIFILFFFLLQYRTSLLPFFLPPMANNNSSSISNPHEPSKSFTCITLSSVTKLLPSNYLTWKLQVEALLDGYDLLKYPDGSFPMSPMTISTTVVPPTSNPAYQTWRRQDLLIYGALLTTLSPEVASLVSQTTTSHDLWTLLQRTYAKASRSHLKQLKERLHTASKGNQSNTTYMHSLKQNTKPLLYPRKIQSNIGPS
ncbi:hypothetical protein V8G54_027758 [Vigna mungo]|uniref:Glutaredoxin domain-containing protein n=1 Tax=Vigna mungo TaxID=3915 RepID=A0AAQ3RJZ1_VIGMU